MLRLEIPDMHCGGCARRVTRAIQTIDPAATVRPDLAGRTIDVLTIADPGVIRTALEEAGYPPADPA